MASTTQRIQPVVASSDTVPSNEFKLPVVLVIGLTGAGKTTLINHLTDAKFAIGKSIDACTTTSRYATGRIDGVEVAFLGTPGFDDPAKSNAEILLDITDWLSDNLGGKTKVTAALYLHSILTEKMYGSAVLNLSLFSKLVGSESMRNVGLVSTHWDVAVDTVAKEREAQLIAKRWESLLEEGARIYRLRNDLDSAQTMIKNILLSQPSFIKIQKEISKQHEGKPLRETEAGRSVCNELSDRILETEGELEDIQRRLRKGKHSSPKAKAGLERDLESVQSRLAQLYTDQENVRERPSWSDTAWGYAKTYGPIAGSAIFTHGGGATAVAAIAEKIPFARATAVAAVAESLPAAGVSKKAGVAVAVGTVAAGIIATALGRA